MLLTCKNSVAGWVRSVATVASDVMVVFVLNVNCISGLSVITKIVTASIMAIASSLDPCFSILRNKIKCYRIFYFYSIVATEKPPLLLVLRDGT